MRGHDRALVGILASQWLGAVVSVGNAPGIVPFAYDQDVVMKVNGHPLSGIPEEYVAGRVDVRGRGALCPGGSLMFEVVKYPKYGQFGWNNTGSGEFIYSPRDYQALTTNHGVEAEEAVPGCKWDCENCPNYPTIPGVSIGNAGPNQPVADPTATAVCNGHMTTCDGFRSTLRDSEHPEQERYVPLSSVWGSRWVSGYICPEVTEAQTKEYLHHRDHRFSRNLNDMDQEVRARVECRDIPPRLCVAHMADVPSDSIKFRVVNGFGISNIGEVRIKFERNDRSDFVLKFTIMIGAILAIASCTGLLRVISLQLVLHPEYSYKSLRSLAGFCPPTEDPFIPERSAHDFRPDWLNELEAIWPPPGYVERKQKALRDKELRRLGDALHDREMKAKANKGHENRVHGHRGKPAGVMQTLEKELEDMVHNAVDDIIHPSHILHGHHHGADAAPMDSADEAGKSPKKKSRTKGKIPNPIKMTKKNKNKRDGADESEFGMEVSRDSMRSRSSMRSPSSQDSELTEADGDLRVSAAMGMRSPAPPQEPEPEPAGESLTSFSYSTNILVDREFDDDGAEIENPVAGGGTGSTLGGPVEAPAEM